MKRARNKSNLSIVKDYLKGERPFVQVGYQPAPEQVHKDGEIWKDRDGKEWIQNGATKISKTLYDTKEATRQICPECNMDIFWGGNNYDEKMFLKTGKCYDCLVKEESRMRLDGTFEIYEKIKIIKNQQCYLKELKDKITESITWLTNKSNKIEYVNEDGSTDTWTDVSRETFLEDANKDLIEINKCLILCNESISMLEKELDARTTKNS